jgi:hypothetical protein
VQQIAPDFFVTLTQQRFAPFFLSLIIVKQPTTPPAPPTYGVSVIFHSGASDVLTIPVALVDGFGVPVTDGYGNPISVGSQTGGFIAQ